MIHHCTFKFCFPFNLRRYAMGSFSGSAYIYTRDFDGAGAASTTWTQRAKLVPYDGTVRAYFGSSVTISGQGQYNVARHVVDAQFEPSNLEHPLTWRCI
jgi:hypothetical protein